MNFYVGLDHPCDAKQFSRCMVSVNAIRERRSDFTVNEWILDSGAFKELEKFGRYRWSTQEYAERVIRWGRCGKLMAAVSQDYMCEEYILARTGLTVREHQRLTISRYKKIDAMAGAYVYIMPVLQGYTPAEYLAHLKMYGELLRPGQWVGVGSVCKRNGDVAAIEQVLVKIHRARPDLHLHGFGVKLTALQSSLVRECLFSCDSMAWSYSARKQGRDQHDIKEAQAFIKNIETQTIKRRDFQEEIPY